MMDLFIYSYKKKEKEKEENIMEKKKLLRTDIKGSNKRFSRT